MKLQSQVSREYEGTKYEKFWVVIPNKLLELLGWKSGQELNAEVKGGKLVIEKEDGKN
ncbi:MAG: AbrB/MazE/SpoVT family DNA-binding domain-containing protein [Nanoarchaeota archaeon]